MKPQLALTTLFLTILVCANFSPCLAQGFTVEGGTAPSVVGLEPFVSGDGRFSVALPKQPHSFSPLSYPTPFGQATGSAYNWKMKEGAFTVAFVEAARPLDAPGVSKGITDGVRKALEGVANSKNGKLASEKEIKLAEWPGVEFRVESPSVLIVQRIWVVVNRLYQLVLVLPTSDLFHETVATKTLDSFKILSEAEAKRAAAEVEAKALPSPLPQEPAAARAGSDAKDEGLLGPVKSVLTESEDLSGTWTVQGRKSDSLAQYNTDGNLNRTDLYDYKGNLSTVTVYGYIDGARVSNFQTIEREYNPPPIVVSEPNRNPQKKVDGRYIYRFEFKYDEKKRLIEKTSFHSTGGLWLRYVYEYSGNQREELVYSADGSLNQRYLSILDPKGNPVEKTSFETGDGSIKSKNSYSYDYDAKGNWIKRTNSKVVTTSDGKPVSIPQAVYYRTITYYN